MAFDYDTRKVSYPEPCRICATIILSEDDAEFHYTYWQAIKFPVCKTHTPEERKAYKLDEAYECQCIDADCNDCKHFKRGKRMSNKDSFSGYCMKLNKPIIAHVNYASGHECFEHRRAP